ncbi:MAG: VanZ family protein [Sulfurovum sp.]|nr:VanZ family protein [Sulfurovum sp.]
MKRGYKIAMRRLLQKEIVTRSCRISFFAALIVIEYLATTARQIEVITHSWDKLNHLAAFAVLYVLLSGGYGGMSVRARLAVLMLFALQIEIVQAFIPGREFSFADIVADGIGIFIGWVHVQLWLPIKSEE